jgi:nucleotide sugar dehydrogenase
MKTKGKSLEPLEECLECTLCIVGDGPNSLKYACLFAEAGFKVVAVNNDPQVVSMIQAARRVFNDKKLNQTLRNHIKDGKIIATTDIKGACAKSHVIAIFVPVEIDDKERPDYSHLEKTCKAVGMGLRKDALVIVMTPLTPGTTEGLVKEMLEFSSGLKAGEDFSLGYAPPNICPRIAAGIDKKSAQAVATVLETVGNSPIAVVNDLKVAETIHLFSLIHKHVETTLAAELSVFCEKIGVDYLEIQKTLNQSSISLPIPEVSRLNSRLVHVFLNEAEALNLKMRITSSAKETAEETLTHIVRLVRKSLRKCGKPLRRSRIAFLGVSAKPNVKKEKNLFVKKLAEKLTAKGVMLRVYDPFFTQKELNEMGYPAEKTLKQTAENADCFIITVPHERFKKMSLKKLSLTAKMPAAIVDLAYIIDPEKAEKEGFVFCGLGRGVY